MILFLRGKVVTIREIKQAKKNFFFFFREKRCSRRQEKFFFENVKLIPPPPSPQPRFSAIQRGGRKQNHPEKKIFIRQQVS